jgi:hypothetical protein
MKKQPKKLTLNKETLRDLTAHNAGEIKAGAKGVRTRKCKTVTCGPFCQGTFYCPRTVAYDTICC